MGSGQEGAARSAASTGRQPKGTGGLADALADALGRPDAPAAPSLAPPRCARGPGSLYFLVARRSVLVFALACVFGCRGELVAPPEPPPGGERAEAPARPAEPAFACPSVPAATRAEAPDSACGDDLAACAARCDAGDGAACVAFALASPGSRGAMAALREGCARGILEGCFRLAVLLDHGVPVVFAGEPTHRFEAGLSGLAPDRGCAIHLYEVSCGGGHLKSCSNLGLTLTEEGPWRDDRRSAELLDRTCSAGLPIACVNLGSSYKHGTGVARDEARARSLFRETCEAGEYAGCLNLAAMVEAGQGGPRDLVEAAALHSKACDLGAASACGDLGRLTEAGEGLPRDLPGAIGLYRRACSGGNAYGCLQLERLGVGKDP